MEGYICPNYGGARKSIISWMSRWGYRDLGWVLVGTTFLYGPPNPFRVGKHSDDHLKIDQADEYKLESSSRSVV